MGPAAPRPPDQIKTMHVLLLETIALVGATVHTFQPAPEGASGAFAEPTVATVLVEDGQVRAVGPDIVIPEGAREVDLSGHHLVPGFIDALTSCSGISCLCIRSQDLE